MPFGVEKYLPNRHAIRGIKQISCTMMNSGSSFIKKMKKKNPSFFGMGPGGVNYIYLKDF